jgi:hypothetical protein
MSMESHGEMILTAENQRIHRKFSLSGFFSITNSTWTDLGINLGLRVE